MTPKLLHIDLFSGIGGFAYAVDQVWNNIEHIFCENNFFCQQIIKKHWKGSKIYEDINEFIAYAGHWRQEEQRQQTARNEQYNRPFILTGGFPCQPFSQAGKRGGTNDNRYLWPQMLRVIQLTKPAWVIAENVRGILIIEGGLVFEKLCLDLEACNYAVQPFIIPAVAVNAPHRRDRVWIVANRNNTGSRTSAHGFDKNEQEKNKRRQGQAFSGIVGQKGNAPDTGAKGFQGSRDEKWKNNSLYSGGKDWSKNWLEVATELCGMDDGLPVKLDGFELTKAKHRNERLKSLGNSIVPQVVFEIFRAIKYVA